MPKIFFLYQTIPNFYLRIFLFHSGLYNFAEVLMALGTIRVFKDFSGHCKYCHVLLNATWLFYLLRECI